MQEHQISLDYPHLVETLQRSILGRHAEGFDVEHLAYLLAAYESAAYYTEHLLTTPRYNDKFHLLSGALARSRVDGLVLEFGVAHGESLRYIARQMPNRKIYGFDSFAGLPEDWRSGFPKGTFSQPSQPEVPGNCKLVIGLFEDTLPRFLDENESSIAFIHVDCDLYSSTRTALFLSAPFVKPGTIIVFDEYFNFPGWKKHEFRAWQEFCETHKIKAAPIGLVRCGTQVAFIVE